MNVISKNQLHAIRDVLVETKESGEPALDLDDCLEMVIGLITEPSNVDLESFLDYNAKIRGIEHEA